MSGPRKARGYIREQIVLRNGEAVSYILPSPDVISGIDISQKIFSGRK
jgi:hypothetical protein